MGTDLTGLDAAELGRRLAAGETSSVELTRAYLDRIAAQDDVLGAYLHVDGDDVDARRAQCRGDGAEDARAVGHDQPKEIGHGSSGFEVRADLRRS